MSTFSDDIKYKVVGQNLNEDGKGSVTFAVPVEQMDAVQSRFDQKRLAKGSKVDTNFAWARADLGQRYGLRESYQAMSIPSDRAGMIALAKDLRHTEPVIANVIDIFIDFCLTGMNNVTSDAKAQVFYDNLCKYGDFDGLHREIFREYFESGDIFILRGKQQKVKGGTDNGAVYYEYTVLNPLQVQVDGPLSFDLDAIGIIPPPEIKKMMDDKNFSKLVSGLPNDLKQAAQNGNLYYPKPDEISRISLRKASYERYPTPYLTRVFEPALIKRRMRDADVALAETVRYVLVTVTIGNDEFPARDEDIATLASMFDNTAKSMELFWNHTLAVKFHFPDAALFGNEKYAQVDKDILFGLGVPDVLIGGNGGTFATAWVALLSVMERLESARNQVARWQEEEYRRVAEATKSNFKEIPKVKFSPLNLRDDKNFQATLISLYDRGLLSYDTLLTLSGHDFATEARKREAEKSAGLDATFAPRQAPPKAGGRPTDTVDPGNYPTRDKVPPVDKGTPDQPSSNTKNSPQAG